MGYAWSRPPAGSRVLLDSIPAVGHLSADARHTYFRNQSLLSLHCNSLNMFSSLPHLSQVLIQESELQHKLLISRIQVLSLVSRLQSSEADDDKDEDEQSLAAFGCLRALSTVLESVSSLPEIFPTLEPVVLPILQKMCSQEGQDVFEEIMEILSYFTYFAPQVKPAAFLNYKPLSNI